MVCCIPTTLGEYEITSKQLGLNVDRQARVLELQVQYNSTTNVGQVFTATIQSLVNTSDANARTPARMVTTLPQWVKVRNPVSSDFGYVSPNDAISIISVTCGNTAAGDDQPTFYNVRALVEYHPAQAKRATAYVLDPFVGAL